MSVGTLAINKNCWRHLTKISWWRILSIALQTVPSDHNAGMTSSRVYLRITTVSKDVIGTKDLRGVWNGPADVIKSIARPTIRNTMFYPPLIFPFCGFGPGITLLILTRYQKLVTTDRITVKISNTRNLECSRESREFAHFSPMNGALDKYLWGNPHKSTYTFIHHGFSLTTPIG